MKITFDDTPAAPEAPIEFTTAAAVRTAEIIAKKPEKGRFLRLKVIGGGCNGYTYKFDLETEKAADDIEITAPDKADVPLLVDPHSASLLGGSIIDFEETLVSAQFVVKNPNAKSSCGCGTSFGV